MIVGDLGEDEVLLLAFDDGDIIAYRIKAIGDEIARTIIEQKLVAEKKSVNGNVRP
jgi:hypothetical protein